MQASLNNVYLLEELLENAKIGFEGGKLIAAFKTFNAIRQTCFGNVLNSSYRDSILSFEKAYKILRISITPKVHAIIKYIPEFIDNQAEKHDNTQQKLPTTLRKKLSRGLGFCIEQTESVHADFIRLRETGTYKQNLGHPEHCKKLKKCTIVHFFSFLRCS